MKRFLLLTLLCCSFSALFSQITGPVMKVENSTACDKYVVVRESNPSLSCMVTTQTFVVPPFTTIAVFSTGPGWYFDAAQVADYSGIPAAPVTPGCFNVKIQGIWSVCPLPLTASTTGTSCCTGGPVTANMAQLYIGSGSNAAYIIIN